MAEVEVLNIDTSQAQNSVKALREQLKLLKDQMSNLEEGSDEFLDIASKAGEVKHQLDEINASVRGASSDFGDLTDSSLKALNGIVGGLTAAQGALSLFGIENEDVIKSIKQLQSLMAIGTGIQQIDSGIKALNKLQHAITGTTKTAKLLRAAMTPKTILILTAAIMALLKLWQKFGDQIKTSIPLLGKISEKFQSITGATEDATVAQKKYNDELVAADEKLQAIILKNRLGKLNADAKKQYDDMAASVEELQARLDLIVLKQKRSGIGREEWEKLNAEGKQLLDTITQLKNQQDAILDDPDSYRAKKEVKAVKEEVSALEKALADIKTRQAENNALRAQGQITEEEYLNTNIALEREKLSLFEKEKGTSAEATQNYYNQIVTLQNVIVALNDYNKALADGEAEKAEQTRAAGIAAINTELAKQQALLDQRQITESNYNSTVIALEESKLQFLQQGTQEYYNQLSVIAKLKEGNIELADASEDAWKSWTQVAQAGLSGIGSVLSGIADLQDTTTKEGIQKQANLQYAAAVFNTANAIIGAWTSAMALPAPASFILGGIQTAAAAALGGVQIAKIKKTAAEAGASLKGSSANASSSAINSAIVAPVQYSSATQNAQIQSSIADTRVYVTEGDISRAQNKVRVAESENRF